MRHLLLAALITLAPQHAMATPCSLPDTAQAEANDIARGLAAFRAARGLNRSAPDAKLSAAAQAHACHLAAIGQMTHVGRGGTNSMQRALSAGAQVRLAAENLAWGYRDGARVVALWSGSAAHARNMAHPRATRYGLGIAQSPRGPYWVLLLGG